MHERLHFPGHEAVIDEEVFFDAELLVAAFEIAGTIIFHAMTQNQILSAGWCADRIGLHETHLLQCVRKRRGLEQAARDREAAQVIERNRHAEMLSESAGIAHQFETAAKVVHDYSRLRAMRGEHQRHSS
jgi:hypothetical protein